jgi:hypothetical protein
VAARALILLSGLLAGPAVFAAPTLEWRLAEGTGEVRVCGLAAASLASLATLGPEKLGEVLSVRVVDGEAEGRSDPASLPELWGRRMAEGECLLFRPRHQPAPGMVLRATFRGDAYDHLSGHDRLSRGEATPTLELRVVVPPPERRTRVVSIHPSGEQIPENLLRVYVTFSAAMSLKDIEKHVHLRDETGAEIPNAFVEIPGGLWDPGRRRLTLILHPGRVKSGIALGEAMGKVLQPGQGVTLEIDAEARDAEGASLLEGSRRKWRIGPAQRQALDVSQLRIAVPKEEGAAFEIEFPVALDRALALKAFTVKKEGQEVAGSFELETGEQRLRFEPEKPWRRGETYILEISAALEDVAGNRLGRAFEVSSDAAGEAAAAEIPWIP